MGRVQLAINVSNLDEAVEFYRRLFATEPNKVKPGYANFAITDPPLKLVLMEGGQAGALNHLGVEVTSTDEVAAAQSRLADEGLAPRAESGECCYAVQDKVWVTAPDAVPWEVYTVIADVEAREAAASGCCSSEAAAATACC